MAKTGRGCIPYSSLSNLGCVVQGLPAGVSFKQPASLYNTHELRSICNHLESIEFIVVDVNDTVVMPLQCQVVCMQMSLLTSTVATHLNDWILAEDIIKI